MTRTALLSCSIAGVLVLASAAFAQQATRSSLPPGWVTPTPALIAEPALLRKLVDHTDGTTRADGQRNDGLSADFGDMITGSGWISAGPGYRREVLGGRAFTDLSAAVSWRLYKIARSQLEFPRLAHGRLSFGVQGSYQDLTQVNYYGIGADSRKSDRSGYRLHNADVLTYAALQAAPHLAVSGRFGWIPSVNLSTATGPKTSFPNTGDLFSEDTAPGIHAQPAFVHGDVSVAADWRDHPGHPTRGGLYRATAGRYSDRLGHAYSFGRYEIEALQFLPMFDGKWILALRGWEVFSTTSAGATIPFYLMPSLGGQNTLRGYHDYRFHDNDLQSFNVESRVALFAHVDAAAFADAGKVAARADDLDFRYLKTSYGVGFRVHNATSTVARLDIGHGAEGWRVFFKLSDPFKRAAPSSSRSTVIPFVP